MTNKLEYQFVKDVIPSEIEYNSILNITTSDVNTFTWVS